MSALADMVARLIANGFPPERVSEIIELAELHVDEVVNFHRKDPPVPPESPVDKFAETAAKRRAYDRKRKERLRWISGRNSGGNGNASPSSVPPMVSPITPSLTSSTPPSKTQGRFSFSNSPSEVQQAKEEIVELQAKAPRGTRLPPDWTPSPEDVRFSRNLIGEVRTQSEFAKFVDYWRAKAGANATKLDWSATWRNWARKAAETSGKSNGKRSQLAEAFAELKLELGGEMPGGQGGAGMRDVTPPGGHLG